MQVIITLEIHFRHEVPKNNAEPNSVISGKTVTKTKMPISVKPKPINPIMVKMTKEFLEEDFSLSVTWRKTKLMDSSQLTIKPTTKPNAVDNASEMPCHAFPAHGNKGNNTPSNSQNTM